MTVLELFKKYDFESVLPHLDHLFVVNSKHHLSDASVEVFRGIYNHYNVNDAQQTTSANIIVYKYCTTRMDGAYTDSNESILLFLLPDEKDRTYKILLFTRQRNDTITKNLVKDIWPQEEFNPWSADKSRHIHKEISFEESDEIIAHEMEAVLQEVKAYRDEKFPL